MKNKKLIILMVLLLFWGYSNVKAQNNAVASGGEASGSGGVVSYTAGQIVYINATGSGGSANQGIQQPFEFFVLGTDDHPEIILEMAVYPNPTANNVSLRIGNFLINDLSFKLYDMQGRLLVQKKIGSEVTQIYMEDLAAAVYLLHITQRSSTIKSFKIIKK